ncbi:MAG: DCC1-like thiol-disulfide oxidoreductase family protein [Planctomycetota bacterium]
MDLSHEEARQRLIEILQHAHSGETAALNAYEGHWRSLRDPGEAALVRRIQQDEIEHKAIVATMLSRLGAAPNSRRDRVFFCIGRTISSLCRLGGWYIPMYGAGRLEAPNSKEYDDAADCAIQCGCDDLVTSLRHLAEVEREHERTLRTLTASHWLSRYIPLWRTTLEGAEQGALPCLLVFDGDCRVCNATADFLERHDRKKSLVLVASGSPEGVELQKRHGVDVLSLDTMLVIRGQRAFVRSDAGLEIAAELGGPWLALLPLRLIPRRFRDAIYTAFAKSRYRWLGKTQTCKLVSRGD